MNERDRERLVAATGCAHLWHRDQYRKGTSIPYVSHLLQVQGLVLEHGGNGDQAIAALLHDSLEDAPDAPERARRKQEIGTRFGPDVLQIVMDCTDTLDDESLEEKGPWRERKLRYIDQLTAASPRSLLVAACDKRHNLHSIVWDVEIHGVQVFDRFTGSPLEQIWYFSAILELLRGKVGERLMAELEALLSKFRDQVSGLDA